MQTILVAGGTGLIGRRLTSHLLGKGYQVIILTRILSHKQNNNSLRYAAWDIKKQYIDIEAIRAADYIIQLAGAPVVEKKWTKAYQQEIIESRTLSTKLLIDSIRNYPNKVRGLFSASGIGWYGPDKEPGHYFVESDNAYNDFLGQTCLLWEQAAEEAAKLGIRVCKFRQGIVLSNDGGALEEFKKPVKAGVAAILSDGKQVVSWIHIEDLCRMYSYAIENEMLRGSFNAVAPGVITNKELTLAIAKTFRGNFYIPMHVPSLLLKLVLGKRSIEVLKSATVSCEKIHSSGFTFLYPSIQSAMENLVKDQA